MNDEELKKLWQEQPLREPKVSAGQVISAMQNKMSGFRRALKARDMRELLACAVVVIVFGLYAFYERTPIVRVGWLIVVASMFFIAWKLVHARRSTPPAPADATIIESLRAELNSVRTQSRLLGSVLWWYLLPPGIGLLIATWGMPVNFLTKIPLTLTYVGVYGFVYWLNQWARTKQLLPMEAQLESLLRSAETGEPVDEKHAASLHPIVVSMTASEGVKPAEFKVAFWQIAIYGEIGFVGIWFFGMLGVTEGNIARMFTWQHLVWIVPFFLGGLLFSKILQKGTERAVGISSLGVHLFRGQQIVLWEEIKEVRILRVLNIRSLWLIRESGEKMIMPWSSLERHSELKAAVEDFAPANHPIRKHLYLLTRV